MPWCSIARSKPQLCGLHGLLDTSSVFSFLPLRAHCYLSFVSCGAQCKVRFWWDERWWLAFSGSLVLLTLILGHLFREPNFTGSWTRFATFLFALVTYVLSWICCILISSRLFSPCLLECCESPHQFGVPGRTTRLEGQVVAFYRHQRMPMTSWMSAITCGGLASIKRLLFGSPSFLSLHLPFITCSSIHDPTTLTPKWLPSSPLQPSPLTQRPLLSSKRLRLSRETRFQSRSQ